MAGAVCRKIKDSARLHRGRGEKTSQSHVAASMPSRAVRAINSICSSSIT
jgi:hypothetical protein